MRNRIPNGLPKKVFAISFLMGLCPEDIAGAKRFGVRQLAAAFNQPSLLAVPLPLYRH
ncbi:MAG: hypothetical protein WB763_13400 [Terriglobia bacterium]|jgi:hypothetical protein